MVNLFWSIYRNLENEVLNLAQLIHFDDNQLSVYSVRIADLLIRCSVEIEAISKELYELNGGNMNLTDNNGNKRDLYFDNDCLDFLEKLWRLSERQVIVSATDSFFIKDENKILTPLKRANKRGSSGSDWKKAYQAVKHNRTKDLEKANIKHLIRAIAALYLLNIYYKSDEPLLLDNTCKLHDTSRGSNVFSIKTTVCIPKFPEKKHELDSSELTATYIVKPTDRSCSDFYKEATTAFQRQKELLVQYGYEMDINEDGDDLDIEYSELYQIALDIGGAELVQRISDIERSKNKALEMRIFEAVLNKSPILIFIDKELEEN